MKVDVAWDSGPASFRMHGREYVVEEVLDTWYGREDAFFKVRANDGNVYVLRRDERTAEGEWSLESFRAGT